MTLDSSILKGRSRVQILTWGGEAAGLSSAWNVPSPQGESPSESCENAGGLGGGFANGWESQWGRRQRALPSAAFGQIVFPSSVNGG